MGTTFKKRIRRIASGERGFTLVELMTVIVLISILVTLAVPVFISATAAASRRTAQANHRIGCGIVEHLFMDFVARGHDLYTDPDTGDPVDASYLRGIEPKVGWVDMIDLLLYLSDISGVDPDDLGPEGDPDERAKAMEVFGIWGNFRSFLAHKVYVLPFAQFGNPEQIVVGSFTDSGDWIATMYQQGAAVMTVDSMPWSEFITMFDDEEEGED